MLQRLQTTFGVHDVAPRRFQSYLSGRYQYVRHGSIKSAITRLICGVPQGSILGPVLFVLYTADLISLIESRGLCPHLYADDTQVYGSRALAAVNVLSSQISQWVSGVARIWM